MSLLIARVFELVVVVISFEMVYKLLRGGVLSGGVEDLHVVVVGDVAASHGEEVRGLELAVDEFARVVLAHVLCEPDEC